jgi:hypothetical protein
MDDGNESRIEILTDDGEEAWATLVWKAQQGRCSSCGVTEQLKVHLVVPMELGGKEIVSNGILLCRTCELARDIANRPPSPASGEHTRPINFWVSRGLHGKLTNGLSSSYGFKSISSLVRFLMRKYAEDPKRFDDAIMLFQDSGTDTKVNVWVGRELYSQFKDEVDQRGITVTDTLKGLIQMWEVEHEKIVGRTQE